MKILVLDDEKDRHEGFGKRFPDDTIWHCYTAEAAIRELGRQKFHLVCLDHDLGPDAGNGFQVAVYIANLPPEQQPEVVWVHSWNVPAGRVMCRVLTGDGTSGMVVVHEAFKEGN